MSSGTTVRIRRGRPCWWSRRTHDGVSRAMKKTVSDGGGDGGERKSSLRNRRRRGPDDDPPRSQPSATVTSGALHSLRTATQQCSGDSAAPADDWLFVDWLDGGGGAGTGGSAHTATTASTYTNRARSISPPHSTTPARTPHVQRPHRARFFSSFLSTDSFPLLNERLTHIPDNDRLQLIQKHIFNT